MKLVVSLILLLMSLLANAQPPIKFSTTAGGNGYDCGYDLKQTLDNAFIIAGSTSSYGQGNTDMYLVKLDSMGNKKIQKTFGSYNNETANSVIQLLDSSYVMAGYTNSIGFGGYDMYLVKADKNGNFLWEKTIGGSDWDFANSIFATSDGGFVIGGTTYSYGRGNADGYVIKADANGIVAWSKTYGGKYDDEFKSVIQTSDGGYALTGYSKSYNDSTGNPWVFKLDLNGDSVWCKFYGGNKEDFGNDIIENSMGDFFIAGATESFGVGLLDAYAFKINSTGALLNVFVDGTPSFSEIYTSVAISKRTASNIVCFSEKEKFGGHGLQIKVIEFDFDFVYKNASEHGSTVADETYQIIATKDKGYASVGYTYGFSSVLSDCYFFKIDSTIIGGAHIVSIPEIELQNFKISVYPNPTSNELNVQANISIESKEIKLFDVTGKEIFIKENISSISNTHIRLNLESLSNGIYYLKYLGRTEKISIIHQ